jgi:transcriptional regulator with XRE-family HTH domain
MSHNMKTKKRKTAKPTPASIRRNAIIRTWLAFSGVSISELGRRVSGSENSVKDILSGKVKQPTARTLQAIARHLGIETAALENDALPMPQFGYGADACGHARIRIPEACIARNELQELDFVPFPGNGIEVRLEQVEHLSMAGAGALRIWRVWNEDSDGHAVRTFDSYLVDLADRSAERPDAHYIAIEQKADVVIRTRDQLIGNERIIGKLVDRLPYRTPHTHQFPNAYSRCLT